MHVGLNIVNVKILVKVVLQFIAWIPGFMLELEIMHSL